MKDTQMNSQPVIGIIVTNDFVKRLPFGGASGFIQNIMHKLGGRVVLFGAAVNGTPVWQPHRLGEQVDFVGCYRQTIPSRFPLRIQALWGYLRNRRRILASGVDLLYVHSPECTLPFLFGSRRLPVVFHQHGSGNPVTTATFTWARNGLLERLFDQLHQTIYRRADWIIAIDRLCLQQAQDNGAGGKTSLLMNAVDRDQFKPDSTLRKTVRQAHGMKDDTFMLFFVGRLEEIKQLDRLLTALPLVRKNVPCRLLVAGDGTHRARLEQQAAELELDAQVTFLGKVSHDQLPGYYNAADVLVLPSKMEGVPMVILESLACGTPVLATAVGGIPDLVRNGENGQLLDDVEPESIVAALHSIAANDWNRQQVAATVSQWGAVEVTAYLSGIFNRLVCKGAL
jgi:glycosyltransferase involved in cell wall biosynthesis